ncbi:hypothetical protein V491_04851 [Pseudogymnoascus sp. VKM F-3775]|nr:hypothetical protein V491_04851 [Pseudogymnoascus sp. VKM F-3775]
MSVWFISGCSSGFGDQIARQALARGDKVVATARNAAKLSELKELGALTLSLDITSPDDVIQKVVKEAIDAYGTIDYLINNAGYILEAATEEASDAEIRAQFSTNVFGHVAVIRAVLPYMRAAKKGVVANLGSIAGWGSDVGYGYYSASKMALVGITEALRQEEAHLGIQAVIIDPGYFRTNFLGSDAKVQSKNIIDDLRPVMDPVRDMLLKVNRNQPGDPVKGAAVIIEVLTLTGRAAGKKLPLRLALGSDAITFIADVQARQAKELEEWADIVKTTDHED